MKAKLKNGTALGLTEKRLCNDCLDKEYTRILNERLGNEGWAVLYDETAQPIFTYTVGLTENFDHPELIVSGISPQRANSLFEGLTKLIRKEGPLPLDQPIFGVATVPLVLKSVVDPSQRMLLEMAVKRY